MNERHFDEKYRERVTLKDGTKLTLRLVRPEDKKILLEGFEKLSPASRYLRFFSPKSRLTDSELRYLTEVDGINHFALGAVIEHNGHPVEGVGVGRFVRLKERADTAEPAIAVLDQYQGRGIGALLFSRLAAAAAERGIKTFQCEVLADNLGMRELLLALDPEAEVESNGPYIRVRVAVPEVLAHAPQTALAKEGPLYSLLRWAAEEALVVRRALDWWDRTWKPREHDERVKGNAGSGKD